MVYYHVRKEKPTWDAPLTGRYRKVGERVMVGGKAYRVQMVNCCRARCVPLRKNKVTIKDRVFNKTRTFMANGSTINICPIVDYISRCAKLRDELPR